MAILKLYSLKISTPKYSRKENAALQLQYTVYVLIHIQYTGEIKIYIASYRASDIAL